MRVGCKARTQTSAKTHEVQLDFCRYSMISSALKRSDLRGKAACDRPPARAGTSVRIMIGFQADPMPKFDRLNQFFFGGSSSESTPRERAYVRAENAHLLTRRSSQRLLRVLFFFFHAVAAEQVGQALREG